MVYKCVCVGCKSGYESCPDKVHCFTVPKDNKLRKQWQIAIWRDDIKLKGGEVVCQKHFHPEDILRERLLYGPDGITVMGKSTYKKPMLRKGALPALLLGRPEKLKTNRRSRKRMRVEDENKNIDVPEKKEKLNNCNNNYQDEENVMNDTETEPNNNLEDLFNLIVNSDNNSILLPMSWGKTIFYFGEDNERAVNFHKLIGRKKENDQVVSFNEREFIVNKNMTFLIMIHGVEINHERFGIKDIITSIDMLRDVIKIINQCQICQGCRNISRTSKNKDLLDSFSYVDKLDNLRHNKCPFVLTAEDKENNSICKSCKCVKHLLNKKSSAGNSLKI